MVLRSIEDEEAWMWKNRDDGELCPAIHGEQWRKRGEQEKARASRGSGGGCGGRSGARLLRAERSRRQELGRWAPGVRAWSPRTEHASAI